MTYKGIEGLDGNEGRDMLGNPKPGFESLFPWYDSFNALNTVPYRQLNDRANNTAAETNFVFKSQDSPALVSVDSMQQSYTGKPPGLPTNITVGPKGVDKFNLRADFKLYFGMSASKNENIFMQRAKTDWHFDGTGVVQNSVWEPKDTDLVVDGKAVFSEVKDGTIIPYTNIPATEDDNNRFFNPSCYL